jgi:hypothetical protein
VAAFIVFYDANVLYPAELRNFLMHLALIGAFRAKWSADVHEEWISNLLERRPDLTREKLERTRQLMDKTAPDALVTGYEHLIPGLVLPDEKTGMYWRRQSAAEPVSSSHAIWRIFHASCSANSVLKHSIPMSSF